MSDRASDLAATDPDAPDAGNLFRVHWHNDTERRRLTPVPDHLVLGPELTGVEAQIVVALGNRFPMIRAHKVLAAYGCLVPRLLSGSFDTGRHRASGPRLETTAVAGWRFHEFSDAVAWRFCPRA